MRTWSILLMVLAVGLASGPTAIYMSQVFPDTAVSVGINATEITNTVNRIANYNATATSSSFLGDFLFAYSAFKLVVDSYIRGGPAVYKVLGALGAPDWVIAIAMVAVALATARAVVYMVGGRSIDAV